MWGFPSFTTYFSVNITHVLLYNIKTSVYWLLTDCYKVTASYIALSIRKCLVWYTKRSTWLIEWFGSYWGCCWTQLGDYKQNLLSWHLKKYFGLLRDSHSVCIKSWECRENQPLSISYSAFQNTQYSCHQTPSNGTVTGEISLFPLQHSKPGRVYSKQLRPHWFI